MDTRSLTDGIFDQAMTNIIIWTVVAFVIGGIIIVFARRAMKPNANLLKTGVPAQAKILNVWQTGMMINNNPQVGMLLEVNGPGGTYQTETKVVIPMINIPQFQPGVTLPAKVDPTNPKKIALDIYAS